MCKVLMEVEVPKTCGECMFYRKHRDRCIDHVSCALGSYDDSNTKYDANYDNSRHYNCAIVKERAMQQLIEHRNNKRQKELLKALQEYSLREFDDITYKSINDILDIINLAYTTTESGEHEVQVNFNLEKLQWEEYIDGELKRIEKRATLVEFISELNMCSFEDIVSEILFIAEEMESD